VPESCWTNFLTRTRLVQHWTDFCGRLTLQGLQTGSPAAAENAQVSVQMATILNTNCNWWYCVRTAKATFPYWKLLFLSSIFKQLLLKNCAVDFVEIYNVCTREAIIKAANKEDI